MRIKVLFFGLLKDITGRPQDEVDLPEGARVADLLDHYLRQFPRLRQASSSMMVARNQQFSGLSETLADGDEVAFLPPVSGGVGPWTHVLEDAPGGHFFALTREPILVKPLVERLLRGEDGAVVCFEGVVRNNSRGRTTEWLDYECYEPMAIRVMAEIGRSIAQSFPIGRIAMVHRLGRMEIGETSVVIVVTAPHREAAFQAAREGIDRLKKLAPIWKKEHFTDGEVWAEGQWDESLSPGL